MTEPRVLATVSAEPIHAGEAFQLAGSGDGAVVSFLGVVRDNSEGRKVDALEYEAHEQMAESELRRIAHVACEQFGLSAVKVRHRTGVLTVGEVSVLVAAAASHRGAAFEGCGFVIDSLKQTAAIWKKELFSDGTSRWVGHA